MDVETLTQELHEAIFRREQEPELDRALARTESYTPTVWAESKWRLGGMIAYFQQQRDVLRAVHPSLPPGLPRHCMDPVQIARFLGVPSGEFDWPTAVMDADQEAPHRFQLVGQVWNIQYTEGGSHERGQYWDHRGLRHLARLLGEQDHEVPSSVLDGRLSANQTTEETEHLLNKLSPQDEFSDDDVRYFFGHIERLKKDMEAARQKGDRPTEQKLYDDLQACMDYLRCKDDDTLGDIIRRRKRQLGPDGPGRVIHKSVSRAISRALDLLRDKMPRCAAFLERTVISTGQGFVYRPYFPAPDWIL